MTSSTNAPSQEAHELSLANTSDVTRPDPVMRTAPMSTAELGQYEALFLLLCRIRAASSESLWRIFFERSLGVSSRSAAMARVQRLVATGYLRRRRISEWRSVYHLTQRALSSFPSVMARGSDWLRRPPCTSQAHYSWLRSALWAELFVDGFTVGRGPRELAALRRFYLDGLTGKVKAIGRAAPELQPAAPSNVEEALRALRDDKSLVPPFRARCGRCGERPPLNSLVERCARCGAGADSVKNEVASRLYRCRTCGGLTDDVKPFAASPWSARQPPVHDGCGGALREIDVVSVDVAWKREAGSSAYVVKALFIDDPRKSLDVQLAALPAQLIGQPRLPVILRSTDMRSRYDLATRSWRARGPRHHALLRAFTDDAPETQFPFSLTTTVIDYRPELQLWAIHQGAQR